MATTDHSPLLGVCDAGPVIHLDEVGCLDLLADFPRIIIAEKVRDEVSHHRNTALIHPAFQFEVWIPSTPEPPSLEAAAIIFGLHAGEIQSLHMALEQQADMFLTDDTAARLAAGQLGFRAHGTIGILVRAIRRQLRTKQEVLAVLGALPRESTLHLKQSLLDEVLAAVENNALSDGTD